MVGELALEGRLWRRPTVVAYAVRERRSLVPKKTGGERGQ